VTVVEQRPPVLRAALMTIIVVLALLFQLLLLAGSDQNGAIHIATDGNHLQVSCFTACAQIQSQLILSDAQTPDHHKGDQQQ
jgi:hypothetical protein